MSCERTHKEKKAYRIKFSFTLQERRGAWCGKIHQHLGVGGLHFHWIKKGWRGCCVAAPELLGHCNTRLRFVPVLPSACGYREQLVLFLLSSNFQSWGKEAQKSKMAVMFNKVIGLLSNWCHIANDLL